MSNVQPRPWPTWVRSAAWAGLAAVIVVRVAILYAGLDWRTELAVADGLTYLLPMAAVFLLMCVLAFRTRGTAEHIMWGMLAPATVLILVSESYWTWYALTIDPHGTPPGSPLYVLHLTALSLYLFVVFRMTRLGGEAIAPRLRVYLDTLGVSCLVFPFIYLGWTYPAMSALPQPSNAAAVIFAVYPIAAVFLLGGITAIFVGSKAHRWRSWERLTAAGIAVYAVGLFGGPFWYPSFLASDDFGAAWFTTLLGAGYYLLGVAAVYRLSAHSDEAIQEPWPTAHSILERRDRVYPVLMAMALPVLGWFGLSSETPEVSQTLLGTTGVLAFVLVGRGLIMDFMRTQNLRQDAMDRLIWSLSRPEFDGFLADAIMRAVAGRRPLSLVIFTVSGAGAFDTIGNTARERTLSRIAESLHDVGGVADSAFRLCADQFAVVCEGTDSDDAATMARRVWLQSRRDGAAGIVEVFSGIASFPKHGDDVNTLLSAAQSACLQAAAGEDEPVAVYDDGMDSNPTELEERTRARITRATIHALAKAVDARDPDRRDHSANVSELATALAQVLGLPDERVHAIGLAALMHDVGKVGLRDELLMKHEPLTDEEEREIEGHVELGEMILGPIEIDGVLSAVRHHHERWDGSGYPDALAGHDIPLEARILAVCDVFEIQASRMTYQLNSDAELVLAHVEGEAGTRLDPMVVSVFARLIRGLRSPGVTREAQLLLDLDPSATNA